MQDQLPSNVVSVDFSKGRKSVYSPSPASAISESTRQKLKSFEEFLEAGIVSISFDPRDPSVQIPANFRQKSDLLLNFSYGYRIDDFRFDHDGVRATLMFPEGLFYCLIPWTKVFAIHSEELRKSLFWSDAETSRSHLTVVEDE